MPARAMFNNYAWFEPWYLAHLRPALHQGRYAFTHLTSTELLLYSLLPCTRKASRKSGSGYRKNPRNMRFCAC